MPVCESNTGLEELKDYSMLMLLCAITEGHHCSKGEEPRKILHKRLVGGRLHTHGQRMFQARCSRTVDKGWTTLFVA